MSERELIEVRYAVPRLPPVDPRTAALYELAKGLEALALGDAAGASDCLARAAAWQVKWELREGAPVVMAWFIARGRRRDQAARSSTRMPAR